MKILLALSFLSTVLLSGCATLTSGTTQEMSFQATPDGVLVTLIRQVPDQVYWTEKDRQGRPKPPVMHEERRILGKTPFTLQLDRAVGQSVMFSKEGYAPLTMTLTTETNAAFWGNILAGGLFGASTDSASGAIYEYSPSQYMVTLTPEPATMIEQQAGQPQRDKALSFIVRRYSHIVGNLSQGGGEDWSALLVLLHIGPGQDGEARQTIGALALAHPDVAVFATHVTDLYFKK